MKARITSVVPLCLLFAGLALTAAPIAQAQYQANHLDTPHKYLYLTNIELKPEQIGAFERLESDEVQALHAANAPGYHLGMVPITGSNNVLVFHGFDSFADLQKNHDATMAMSKLIDTLRTDDAAEAPLIADHHTSIYSYKEDLSLNAPVDLSKMRFMRIILFHVRSGHDQDFQHTIKLFVKAYQSAIPEARWAMFEKEYGVGSDNVYILVTAMESLSYVDGIMGSSTKFETAVGADQLQLLRTGLDAAVESSEADIYALSPQLSYVPDSWLTASPDFWGKK